MPQVRLLRATALHGVKFFFSAQRPLPLLGFRAVINLIVLRLPLLAQFLSDLPAPPCLAHPQCSPALLTTLHPQQKPLTTVSYSSRLLQVPAPPAAWAIGPVVGAHGQSGPLPTAGPSPPTPDRGRDHWGHLSCPRHLPRVGMLSLQGSASGVMACWYTKAERLPATRNGTSGGGLVPKTSHRRVSGSSSVPGTSEGGGGGLSWTVWDLTATKMGFPTPTPRSCFGGCYHSLTGREGRAGARGWRAPMPTPPLQARPLL